MNLIFLLALIALPLVSTGRFGKPFRNHIAHDMYFCFFEASSINYSEDRPGREQSNTITYQDRVFSLASDLFENEINSAQVHVDPWTPPHFNKKDFIPVIVRDHSPSVFDALEATCSELISFKEMQSDHSHPHPHPRFRELPSEEHCGPHKQKITGFLHRFWNWLTKPIRRPHTREEFENNGPEGRKPRDHSSRPRHSRNHRRLGRHRLATKPARDYLFNRLVVDPVPEDNIIQDNFKGTLDKTPGEIPSQDDIDISADHSSIPELSTPSALGAPAQSPVSSED